MTQDTGTSASSYSSVVQRIDSLLDYDLQSETRKELVAHREAAIVGSLAQPDMAYIEALYARLSSSQKSDVREPVWTHMQFRIVSGRVAHSVSNEKGWNSLDLTIEPTHAPWLEYATDMVLGPPYLALPNEKKVIVSEINLTIYSETGGRAPIDVRSPDQIGSVIYYDTAPSGISFRLYLRDREFEGLSSALLQGAMPSSISIQFGGEALAGEHPPVWDVRVSKYLRIISPSWHMEVVERRADDERLEKLLLKVLADGLRTLKSQLSWIIFIGAAALALMIFWPRK